MSRWTYARYVRVLLGADTVVDFAATVAEAMAGGMPPEDVEATVRATVGSLHGDAGDRVSGSRMLAYLAWRDAGFEARLVEEIMQTARALHARAAPN